MGNVQEHKVNRSGPETDSNLFLFLCTSVSASAVLVTASTEVDKTGASYYGEQTLHYLAVNGETALLQLREYSGPGVAMTTFFFGCQSFSPSVFKQQRTVLSTTWPGAPTLQSSVWCTASCRPKPPSSTSNVTRCLTLGPDHETLPTTGENTPGVCWEPQRR